MPIIEANNRTSTGHFMGADTRLAILLRAWRERALLTQEQLAHNSGLHVRTIRRLEADGFRRPRIDSLRLLADTLRLTDAERAQLIAAARPSDEAAAGTVPRQLPATVAGFVGRQAELSRLTGLLDQYPSSTVVVAVCGTAGVGKTAWAVHAAHRLSGSFVDGQLFVDLHGFTDGVPPVDPGDALDQLLRALGVPGPQIPQQPAARGALYRTRLADKRVLIVLDNASGTEQVAPLLPGSTGCLILITSRRSLGDLSAAVPMPLAVLAPDEATAMFVRLAPHAAADREAVAELVRACGYLPLAISITASLYLRHRSWTIGDLLREVQRSTGGLLTLTSEHRTVAAVFDLSYRHLPADRQRFFGLLGLHPGVEIDPYAAAALTGTPLDEAQQHLDGLHGDHLLEEPNYHRYRMHDLVRAYAASLAAGQETPMQRREALGRLLDYYRHTAATAMDAAHPYERQRRPTVPPAGGPTPDMSDRDRADWWLETELTNLLAAARAAQQGWPEYPWQLSAILHRHLRIRGRYRDAETLYEQALHLAQDVGDRLGEVNALNGLGHVHWRLGRNPQAVDHCERALHIAQEIGDRYGELSAQYGLGQVNWLLGRYEQAVDHYERALQIAQHIGDRVGELQALNGLGFVHWMLSGYEQAADHYRRALQIAQNIGYRSGERNAFNGLGHIHRMLGNYEQAADHYRRALQIAQDIGHRSGEMETLNGLGHLHLARGLHSPAADYYQQALGLARELGSGKWQFEALQGLGRMYHTSGRPDLALTHHQQALQHATELTQPADQARARDGLAHAHHALGQHEQARQHWQHALDILTRLGTDRTEEIQVTVPSIRAHLTNLDRQDAVSGGR